MYTLEILKRRKKYCGKCIKFYQFLYQDANLCFQLFVKLIDPLFFIITKLIKVELKRNFLFNIITIKLLFTQIYLNFLLFIIICQTFRLISI